MQHEFIMMGKYFLTVVLFAACFAFFSSPLLCAQQSGTNVSAKQSSVSNAQKKKAFKNNRKAVPIRTQVRAKKSPTVIKFSPSNPYEIGESNLADSKNPIDKVIAEHLQTRGLKPAKKCSDAVFLRRVTLDLTGRIPTPQAVENFLHDKSPNKRENLVDSLLASEEFVNYMSLRLGDILRIKAEFPINLWPNAAQAYTRFIRKSLADGIGWDKMARRMLTSNGSNFRVGEVNFMRAMQSRTPESIASCTALAFMGMRFDKMPEDKRYALTSFFERIAYKSTKEWKEEIVFDDPSKRAPFVSTLPDGKSVAISADVSPRSAFADWLVKKGNPYFSRAFANRAWAWIFGEPIVAPIDDMFFSANRPTSARLLNTLGHQFKKSGYDIRALLKLITTSSAYSQSFIPDPSNKPEEARKNFAVYPTRRLEAEIIIDSICAVTGTTEIYSSTTPEPYTTMPDYYAATDLPDGSVTTSFLELFGKSPRDTGYADERVSLPSASQKLHMLNSSQILRKISNSRYSHKIFYLPYETGFYQLYLKILSRRPTRAELKTFEAYKPEGRNFRQWEAMVDTMWALFNSDEFSNRH